MNIPILIASLLIATGIAAGPPRNTREAHGLALAQEAEASESAGCRPGYIIEGDEASPDCVKTIILPQLPCDDMMADAINEERQAPAIAHIIRIAIPMPEGDAYTVDIYLDNVLSEMEMWDFCSEDMGVEVERVSGDRGP